MNFATLLLVSGFAAPQTATYDPSDVSGKVTVVDAEFSYGETQRKVPLRIYLPDDKKTPAPVVLFSHGLGAAKRWINENGPRTMLSDSDLWQRK